jgi:hypothetical protein
MSTEVLNRISILETTISELKQSLINAQTIIMETNLTFMKFIEEAKKTITTAAAVEVTANAAAVEPIATVEAVAEVTAVEVAAVEVTAVDVAAVEPIATVDNIEDGIVPDNINLVYTTIDYNIGC